MRDRGGVATQEEIFLPQSVLSVLSVVSSCRKGFKESGVKRLRIGLMGAGFAARYHVAYVSAEGRGVETDIPWL